MLAGILVALVALWASYLINRLWQQSLEEEAREALDAARSLGFQMEPPGLRARQVAVLGEGEQALRVEWRGGVLGPRSVIARGRIRQVLPLIRDAEALWSATGIRPDP